MSTTSSPSWADAGTVLRAAAALTTQETFTSAQVAYLLGLAYDMGREHGADEALAQVFGSVKFALCGDADVPMREATAAHQRAVDAAELRRAPVGPRAGDHRGGPVASW